MQMVTIGTKNQIVIPKEVRKQIPSLKSGQKVGIYAVDKQTIAVKIPEKNWLEESYGAMKEAWKGRDIIKELEEMRNEW